MRIISVPQALLALIFCCCAGFAQKPDGPYVKNEVLVKFAGKPGRSEVASLHARHALEALETLGDTGWRRVRLAPGKAVNKAMAELRKDPDIEEVQPNFYYHLLTTPDDPLWTNAGMYGLPKISAPAAWDVTTGSSTVVVANIDTGMRYTHQDLAANMWTNPGEIPGNGFDDDGNGFADDYYGYDFFFNDPDPIDEHGHGTHTGGTIGAVGNNGLGVVGVNWNIRIMAIKIYDADGFGTTSAMLVNAYNYIRMMKLRGVNIRVTNNSYGGCDESCDADHATKNAIDAMGDAGILNVFAAGNNASNNDATPFYPASYASPSILSVAASTGSDTRASFSNWGAASVDLGAPGSGILSTTFGSDSAYGIMGGTSMATPHVTGAAALLSAFNPDLSVASLKATLINTVDPLTTWGSTPTRTNGRLNVFNALQSQTVCSFNLSAANMHAITKGGLYFVDITAPLNCDFSVKSNAWWIFVEGAEERSGTTRITFRLNVNPTVLRSGTLTIGGRTVTVTQSSV